MLALINILRRIREIRDQLGELKPVAHWLLFEKVKSEERRCVSSMGSEATDVEETLAIISYQLNWWAGYFLLRTMHGVPEWEMQLLAQYPCPPGLKKEVEREKDRLVAMLWSKHAESSCARCSGKGYFDAHDGMYQCLCSLPRDAHERSRNAWAGWDDDDIAQELAPFPK